MLFTVCQEDANLNSFYFLGFIEEMMHMRRRTDVFQESLVERGVLMDFGEDINLEPNFALDVAYFVKSGQRIDRAVSNLLQTKYASQGQPLTKEDNVRLSDTVLSLFESHPLYKHLQILQNQFRRYHG